MKKTVSLLSLIICALALFAQPGYWQNRVEYVMDIDFDVTTHRFTGKQKLTYYNNSPDTLYKLFYHLYFNAFQPGSEMDMRNRNIQDPDKRLNKISRLKTDEQGYHKVTALKQNGTAIKYTEQGTILEVDLDKPVLPGKKTVLEMEFNAQVPVQIRRSGRDNAEGISYSMTQWYPKLCAYDMHGWHANEYLGREFYGTWGDFEVNITIDSAYTLGGTGYLQNPREVENGYEDMLKTDKQRKRPDAPKLTWKYLAPNVHDFAWAADKEFVVNQHNCKNGVTFYMVWQPDDTTRKTWPKLAEYMEKALDWMNTHYGVYPYKQYSFIQGGDGGMEYPMATLITGKRELSSLVGVSVHEMIHSWFQGVLAFDESHYSWMDEGFTTYTSDEVMRYLGYDREGPLFLSGYQGFLSLVESGDNEPLTTHADFFNSNRAYGISAYNAGGVLLHQLRYIVGEKNYQTGMLRFYNEWKFKHPTGTDLKRVMEKVSGLELDWYFEQFVNTTNTVDYAVKSFYTAAGKSYITIERKGRMMMPLEILVKYDNGTTEKLYLPLTVMRGAKTDFGAETVKTLADCNWTNPFYTVTLDAGKKVSAVFIDPDYYLADTDRENNILMVPQDAEMLIER